MGRPAQIEFPVCYDIGTMATHRTNITQPPASTHRVSANCLNPFPKPRAAVAKTVVTAKIFSRRTRQIRLQFDAMAPRAVSEARTDQLIGANSRPLSGWESPSLQATLDEIWEKVQNYSTTAGIKFGTLVSRKRFATAVGIVATPRDAEFVNVPPESVFSSRGTLQKATRVNFRFKSRKQRAVKHLFVPEFRNKALRKNCSLPSGNAVAGPYLVVAVYEPATLLVIRLWLIPVWVSPNQQAMNVVRSDAERGLHDAVFDEGGVGFSPQYHHEMVRIHLGLGHRFGGDITQYTYVSDVLLFPDEDELPIIVELYATRDIKKYDATKTRKNALGSLHQGIYYRFLPIEAQRMGKSIKVRVLMSLAKAEKSRGRQRKLAADFVRPILRAVKFWRQSTRPRCRVA